MDGRSGSEDLFDPIIMADNRCYVEGYHEGFEKGIRQWTLEGRRHGARHGAKVSTELSFYYGFAVTWKCLLQNNTDVKSRKRVKALDSLIGQMEKFPHDDAQAQDLLENVGKVRAKFRQVCAMLNVPTDFNDCVKDAGDTSF